MDCAVFGDFPKRLILFYFIKGAIKSDVWLSCRVEWSDSIRSTHPTTITFNYTQSFPLTNPFTPRSQSTVYLVRDYP